jgi:hypothetical protein
MTARVAKPGDKERILRREDALDFLQCALAAPAKSRLRQTYMQGALLALWLSKGNERAGERGDRRGAPRGGRGPRHDDSAAIALMAEIAKDGEARPHVLAKLAVQSGKVKISKMTTEASVVRRLARRWREEINS